MTCVVKEARARNLLLAPTPVADDEIAEAILNAIAEHSAHLSESALEELNAPAGPPGVGVRRHQLPVPVGAPAGTLPLRDLNGLVAAFHNKWRGAIRTGRIPKSAAVARPPGSAVVPGREVRECGRAFGLLSATGSLGLTSGETAR